jgi:hypothetical protein
MAAIRRSLEFDDDRTRLVVDTEQVDAAVCVGEVTELFGHHEQIISKKTSVVLDRSLEIVALEHSFGGECGRLNEMQCSITHVEESHPFESTERLGRRLERRQWLVRSIVMIFTTPWGSPLVPSELLALY